MMTGRRRQVNEIIYESSIDIKKIKRLNYKDDKRLKSEPVDELPSIMVDQAVDRVFVLFEKGQEAFGTGTGKIAGLFLPHLARLAAVISAVVSKAAAFIAHRARALSAWCSHRLDSALAGFSAAVERGNPAALQALKVLKGIGRFCVLCRRGSLAAGAKVKSIAIIGGKTLFLFAAAFARGVKTACLTAVKAYKGLCDFLELHKTAAVAALCVILTVAVGSAAAVNHYSAYEYMYNGKLLGYVKDKDIVYSTVGLVGDKLSEAYSAQIRIDPQKDISFKRVYVSDQKMDGHEDVLHHLTYMSDMKVTGYAIVADGKRLAVLDSRETVDTLLGQVKGEFTESTDGAEREFKRIDFAENVEIEEIDTRLAKLEDPTAVLDYILTGAVEQQIHLVVKGETLSDIAKMNGLKTAELMALNPEIVPERMQIGQEVKLERIVPLVTVETVEVATYSEVVPYDIVYEDTSAMYQGEQTVKLAGSNGERRVTAEITKQNGIEIAKSELDSSVLVEPSSQVVLSGTKEVPPLIGLGYFEYPTRGRLSSRFGMRWGRHHNGIDLASPSGTAIRAADGGKVTFAGWNGALGYTVIIDHGANRETLYGHCSKLLVSKGDKVYQGQHIANVGSTGNSTGPHLHFEVHINGAVKNPLNYL
ncbi:MAG: M23 family metallopeptidase [Clostridiales Family XIII bacterium]|jgi:murein DD-endopeptidase MepM/ murein hydrolase activator NlpD|nr:M23 family metallopeptidase [Clostridiales Family XIII bacterium]